MSNTPSKAEIEALVKRHGATSYRNRADTQHPAYGFTEDGLNGLIDEVLAKWGTPQPAPVPLSDDVVRDAARYRWLRATTNYVTSNGKRIDVRNMPEKWDAAIDAAIAAQGGK